MGFLYINKKILSKFSMLCLSLLERIFRFFFSEMNEFYLITFHWPKYIVKRELIKTNFLERLSKCSHLWFTIERSIMGGGEGGNNVS